MIKRLTPDEAVSKHVIVILNGKDVTDGCFFADERGVIGRFKKNKENKRYFSDVDKRIVAKEFLRGKVRIALEYGAPQWAQKRFVEIGGVL